MTEKVIGAYCLSNTASFNVYDVDDAGEKILGGVNNNTPEWCDIEFHENEDSEDIEPFIMYGELEIPLSEVMCV